MQFSSQQQAILESWGAGMAVIAGAGSGKTTTMVSKCALLVHKNPKARFIAVSFTEKSARDLKLKLGKLFLDQKLSLQGHWVQTIHGLCASILKEYPQEAGCDGDERILTQIEADHVWGQALESLWFDPLSAEAESAFRQLHERETRNTLLPLLGRVRDLAGFGVLTHLEQAQDPAARALFLLASWALTKYQRLKKRQGVLDFADLEKAADRALQVAFVRADYQQRFAFIVVDEFQDTNPRQASIVERLAQDGLKNLCVVGDPKQSIYRFRDADLTLFEEFCQKLPLQFALTLNFRSKPQLIAYFNQVCGEAFAASNMSFVALQPTREGGGVSFAQEDQGDSLTQHSTQQHPVHDPASVIMLEITTPHELADWLIAEMKRGLKLSETALLVRKIRGNEKWFQALSAKGIPLSMSSGGLFWEDPRVQELVAFLKWWAQPAHSFSGATFLRAPWVGVTDQELDAWVKVDPTFWQPFFSSSYRLARKLKPYCGKAVSPGQLLLVLVSEQQDLQASAHWKPDSAVPSLQQENAQDPPGGEDLASDFSSALLGCAEEQLQDELWVPLLGLWHRVEELSLQGLRFAAIVGQLSSAVAAGERASAVPPPQLGNQLRVLTLHGAKGLEFKHVVLLDFSGTTHRSDMPLLCWDRTLGVYLGGRTLKGQRDRKNTEEIFWRSLEEKKNLAESKRLFYVALTRAQDRLTLVCLQLTDSLKKAASKRAASTQPEPASEHNLDASPSESLASCYLKDNWREWIEANSHLLQKVSFQPEQDRQAFKEVEEEKGEGGLPPASPFVTPQTTLSLTSATQVLKQSFFPQVTLKRTRHSVSEWTLLARCPLAYQFKMLASATTLAASTPSPAQELGTQVHACLAAEDPAGLTALEQAVGPDVFTAKPLIEWMQQSPWMGERLRQAGGQSWRELSFEVKLEGEILVGTIDRVVQLAGQLMLLDFKVSAEAAPQPPGAAKKISSPQAKKMRAKRLVRSYQAQLALYAWALNRLEPSFAVQDIKTYLIDIHQDGVDEIEVVPFGFAQNPSLASTSSSGEEQTLWHHPRTWVNLANRIIEGEPAVAQVGGHCQYCEFNQRCPALPKGGEAGRMPW